MITVAEMSQWFRKAFHEIVSHARLVNEGLQKQVGCDDVRILYFAYRASPEARTAVHDVDGYLAFPHTILVKPAECTDRRAADQPRTFSRTSSET